MQTRRDSFHDFYMVLICGLTTSVFKVCRQNLKTTTTTTMIINYFIMSFVILFTLIHDSSYCCQKMTNHQFGQIPILDFIDFLYLIVSSTSWWRGSTQKPSWTFFLWVQTWTTTVDCDDSKETQTRKRFYHVSYSDRVV